MQQCDAAQYVRYLQGCSVSYQYTYPLECIFCCRASALLKSLGTLRRQEISGCEATRFWIGVDLADFLCT